MLRFFYLFFACAFPVLAAQPNIIFILTDDTGFGDLYAFHQHKRDLNGNRIIDEGEKPFISTPHLDRMVAEGAKMTRHYSSAPVCAPARGSLLQGRDQGHANIRDNSFDKPLADNHTLGSVMKQAGYKTACIGKWGIGGHKAPYAAHPNKRGFDYFYGYMEHLQGHDHYPGNNGSIWEQSTPIKDGLTNAYTTDLFTARAKKWIIQHSKPNTQNSPPFFLYLALDTPHAQLQVPTQKFPKGKGISGGLSWPLNTNSGKNDSFIHPDYSTLPAAPARHATMIRRIDNCVGDLLQTLRDLEIDNNTLVIFSSDNGTHHEAGHRGKFAHNPTYFQSYGELDGIKRDHWEGGIRVPTIAWWPKNISAGSESTLPSTFWDWMPTFTDAAGLAPPAWTNGVTLIPELTNKGTQQHKRHLYFEYNQGGHTPNYTDFHPSHRKAKRGQMQTIFLNDTDGKSYKGVRYNVTAHSDDFRIYDVAKDPGETTNLAEKLPELQQHMKDKVLQVRRPDTAYPRPYDSEPIPSVETQNTKPGLKLSTYQGQWPWVPNFATLRPSFTRVSKDFKIKNALTQGAEFSGYYLAPEDGEYHFSLQSNSPVMLWLHDIHLIDNDFNHSHHPQLVTVKLKAGLHPIRISSNYGSKTLSLEFKHTLPGKQEASVAAESFFHAH